MIPFPNISPEIVSITLFGVEFALRWYALAYLGGVLAGWWLLGKMMRQAALWPQGMAPMPPAQVSDFAFWAVIGIIFGGRLGYVLFYQLDYHLHHPQDVLMLWRGGMAFHGGLLGVVVVIWLYCRRHRIPIIPFADALAVATPPGLFLGRLANFINGELWGRPTSVPWGMVFPGIAAQDCGQAPGEICARHPSQLYQATLEGVLLWAVLIYLAFRRQGFHRPGNMLGVFLAGYGACRFFVEFFRQPDRQFISAENPAGFALGLGSYGITMGQALSLPMIGVGVWLVLRARHQGKT
ncbi:MAG: prolipoprotein diacylglyceryl transferase [Rhodobacteraceae bacterium]|nr:prolipoprotein diacylglyceryl transferase [Paracoccaceae bacterium]